MRFAALGAGLFSIAGFAGTALAADLPARPYSAAPPIVTSDNWTGFYVGISGGYSGGKVTSVDTVLNTSTTHNPTGGLAGGQIGYNWQAGMWFFGLEADGHWANISGSAPCPNLAFACGSETRSLASFRGRLGYAAGPILFYGTGGGGYGNTVFTISPNGGAVVASYSSTRFGYTAGGGIEFAFAPNWSAKLEYLHYGLDGGTAPVGALAPNPVALKVGLDTAKVGINYRFGGPVVARY